MMAEMENKRTFRRWENPQKAEQKYEDVVISGKEEVKKNLKTPKKHGRPGGPTYKC